MASQLHHMVSDAIHEHRDVLIATTVEGHYATHPELSTRYGTAGRDKCRTDAAYHVSFLIDALAAGSPALFTDYVGWAKILLTQLHIPAEDLAQNLQSLADALQQTLPQDLARVARAYVDGGLQQLPQLPSESPSFLDDAAPLAALADAYLTALLKGDRHSASQLILGAVAGGASVREIYLRVFQPVQCEVGRLWQMNEISVAQEHFCTAATSFIMSLLYPNIFRTEKNGRTLVAACVSGDLHELGLRMVSDFFEMDGWDTWYLGANMPGAGIVDTIVQRRADVLALSATMTFHVGAVAEVITGVRAAAACREVKIMVGGYPFNVDSGLWQRVGADGYAPDAVRAITVANQLIGTPAS